MSDGRATHAHDWFSIRSWANSQNRAFEELCYQLRDRAPTGWRTIKTAAPDGGVEWYDKAPDGRCHGHQVKFVRTIDDLLPQARKSVKAVGANRRDRNVVRLGFWVPIDLPDPAHRLKDGTLVEGARKRWEDNVASWKRDLPGVADIDITLMDSGQLLDRLLEPGNEGRRWFFFEQHAMGMQWLGERLEVAKSIAHDRYTPEHHVPLPISSVFDGCAVTPRFLEQLRNSCNILAEALPDPPPPGLSAEAGDEPLEDLCTAVASALEQAAGGCEELREAAAEAGAEGLAANDMAEVAAGVARVLSGATEAARRIRDWRDEAAHGMGRPSADATTVPLTVWTGNMVDRLQSAVLAAGELEALCRGDAARGAEGKAWVLLGEAGQGKTHLLVDATRRALEEGRPSVTVFGELLTAKDPLTQIAQQLGLGALSHSALLQAMDAAGSMCEARFTLIIDALNDSAEPEGWRTALPALLAAAARFDHVAVVVSCRSSLREAVLPDDMPGRGYLVTVHPGFAGHEVEALESYLKAAPSALPRIPMLTPAFSNPLFVKLYCESLLSMPESQRRAAAAPLHRSAVFDSFLDRRATQINKALALDPYERIVHRAVEELGRLMADEGREVLSREQARRVVDALTPQCTAWPNTLLGQLIGHGLVATERYFPAAGRMETGVGFAYQAFSDDRIIHAVLEEHRAEVEAATAAGTLPVDSALRTWLEGASANLIDAATVLLPELIGHELVDLLGPGTASSTGTTGVDGRRRRRRMLYRSLVQTLGLRSTSSVSERTIELLNDAASNFGLGEAVLETVLTVTTQPGHLLNADRLHRSLLRLSPADRDARWGLDTYVMLDGSGALHRLLRWAEHLPTPSRARPRPKAPARMVVRRAGLAPVERAGSEPQPPDEEVVRLAATTLVWTLTSPNRFLRDRATKGLVQLLLGYPGVLTGLLQRFLCQDAEQVADPYLFERLVLVAHGVLARIRAAQAHPDLLREVADLILATVFGAVSGAAHASRNALLCDAAARIVRSAHAAGLIEEADLARTEHPHPCAEVGDAPDETVLDSRYPSRGPDDERLWGSLRSSLIGGLADFASYEVQPVVKHFSLLPVTVPLPVLPAVVPLIGWGVQAFRDSLPVTVRDVLGSEDCVRRLLDQDWRAREVLDDDQYRLLKACMLGPSCEQQLVTTSVDKDWACRWIMDSAVRRGWTPQRFAAFDDAYGYGRGDRGGHKAERVGKKYAWLCLHELVERLANHRHMKQGPHAEFTTYPGAGPLYLTDIDPTLPPAAHPLSDPVEGDGPAGDDRYATFAPSALDGRWNPPAPILPSGDQINDWINGTDQLPDLTELAVRTLDNAPWVVLNEYATDHARGQGWHGQAEQWHIQHSWLVTDAQYPGVLKFLLNRSLMGRWMPEPHSLHGTYLADLPLDLGPAQSAADELRIVDYASTEEAPATAPDRLARGKAPAVSAEPGTAERTPAAIDALDWLDRYAGRSRPKPERRPQQLLDLASRWSQPSPPLASETETRSPYRAYAEDGTVLQAHPAVEEYSWSGSGHDCSLDTSASLMLPCARLLVGSGLRRDPDNGNWYTLDGTRVIYAAHGYRTTGEVTTLLARRDWLERRLTALGMRLVLGLFGERQPRTTDHLRQWREYSQTAGLEPGKPLKSTPRITVVHSNTHD